MDTQPWTPPSDILGDRIQVVYQLYDGKTATIFEGVVTATNPTLVIEHGDRNKYLRSYLRPERIVSIQVMREEKPDDRHP
jgi:hypothetical protein